MTIFGMRPEIIRLSRTIPIHPRTAEKVEQRVPSEYTVPRVSAAIAKIALDYASVRRLGN